MIKLLWKVVSTRHGDLEMTDYIVPSPAPSQYWHLVISTHDQYPVNFNLSVHAELRCCR